ncbi:hypothetical protein J7337_007952 [Fusarium musae]|uniref:Beta-lactamase-related domain-containing protein n=1 Tax=Fusarium musae TaxID=1042133 RepID=A0A9P8DCV5_9HYPO|nr:hypothetical protein J7337_007952 [Fusarium musae]KAG9499496.1 hypothetical protein J7337_007952 [Fusarium musae]
MGDGGYGAASSGARPSVKDLVKLYSSFIKSINFQFSGSAIPNDALPSSLVLFHQGSHPGSLIFVALLPKTETVILVLTNSFALNDAADWIGQLIIEEIVNVPSKLRTDFVGMAEATVAENLKWYPLVVDELEKGRKAGMSRKPLTEYHRFKIDVKLVGDKLYWLMRGLETEMFELAHYDEDTFRWLQPRDELVRNGRRAGRNQGATFWKVKFEASESATINKLIWVPDSELPPIIYTKS